MWWVLGASGIASLTALLIAFVAYPWQKNRDRNFELSKERRHLYAKLLDELAELDGYIWGEPIAPLPFPTLSSGLVRTVHIYAPETVIEALYDELDARHALMEYFQEEFGSNSGDIHPFLSDFVHAQANLMRSLRSDLFGDEIDTSRFTNERVREAFEVPKDSIWTPEIVDSAAEGKQRTASK